MKSLLVDALRAANDSNTSTDAEQPSTAGAEHEHELESRQQIATNASIVEELELVNLEDVHESASEADAALNDDDIGSPAENRAVAVEADFSLELRHREPPVDADGIPDGVAAGGATTRAAIFERAARNAPYLCLALAIVSVATVSAWSRIADSGSQSALLASARLGQPGSRSRSTAGAELPPSRFPLDTTRATADAMVIAPPIAEITPGRNSATIVRNAPRQATPAGHTNAGSDTFATLNAAYRAYLGGEVGREYIDWLLRQRAATDGESAELEIRLLLQQFPEEALLHRALGSALAAAGRLPEAEASVAKARNLAARDSGDDRR